MAIFDNLKKYVKDKPDTTINTSETTKEEPKKKLTMLSRLILHGGNTADAGSTIHALGSGNVREINPLFGGSPSNIKVALTKTGTSVIEDVLLNKLAKKHPKLANGLAKGIGIGMLAVAGNNIAQSKR